MVMGSHAAQPRKRLGAWVAGLANDPTTYQAATDGIVCCYSGVAGENITGKTDGSNPPTTIKQRHIIAGTDEGCVSFPVKKNDYWMVNGGSTAVFWIPLGP